SGTRPCQGAYAMKWSNMVRYGLLPGALAGVIGGVVFWAAPSPPGGFAAVCFFVAADPGGGGFYVPFFLCARFCGGGGVVVWCPGLAPPVRSRRDGVLGPDLRHPLVVPGPAHADAAADGRAPGLECAGGASRLPQFAGPRLVWSEYRTGPCCPPARARRAAG